jgi:hypothetical protein
MFVVGLCFVPTYNAWLLFRFEKKNLAGVVFFVCNVHHSSVISDNTLLV